MSPQSPHRLVLGLAPGLLTNTECPLRSGMSQEDGEMTPKPGPQKRERTDTAQRGQGSGSSLGTGQVTQVASHPLRL